MINNIVTTIFNDMNSGNLTYCQLSIIYTLYIFLYKIAPCYSYC